MVLNDYEKRNYGIVRDRMGRNNISEKARQD